MAEAEELKQMVMTFRVSELQVLATYVGWSKYGRKCELLQRALYHIEQNTDSTRLRQKIRDLFRQIHNPYASEPPRSRTSSRTQVPDPSLLLSNDRNRRFPPSTSGKTQLPSGSLGHVSSAIVPVLGFLGGGSTTPEMKFHITKTCNLENTHVYSPAISKHYSAPSSVNLHGAVDFSKRSQEMSSSVATLPVHPDVRFKPLPFYDIMGELLKPTSLAPKGLSRYQETYFVFHLTPQQAQDIAMSRDFRPTAKWEYTVQVQLRFCFLETSCEQEDNFPPSICVRVNGKVATLPNPIPTTKPGVEPKRPGRPVDITSLCRLSPTMPNHVEISWASEYGRGFVVSINLVKRLTSDTLLMRLKQFGNRHADHSRAMIKEKLHHDADSEIATTSLRVSLLCPLGKMRMQLPSRAGTCNHLQCFDAITFLMMNEKKATWMCPVCDKPAPFHKLIIDGLFCEILKNTDESEIQFVEDGSWSAIKNNKDSSTEIYNTSSVSNTANSEGKDTAVNLCDGDSPDRSEEPPAKKVCMEVIDLTLSDSEDDEPSTRPQSSHNLSSSGSSTPTLAACGVSSQLSPGPHRSLALPDCPPMPPLLNFSNSSLELTSSINSASSPLQPNRGFGLGLNLSPLSRLSGGASSNGSINTFGANGFSMEDSNSNSTQSWLASLSAQTQGQKRVSLGLSSSGQPPYKRQHLDHSGLDSPSSSNSNMSPLVDLDQLCSILDSDRDRKKEEIARFPTDFSMSGSANNSRLSPDVIALD
ncbi:E3 SUMO-protein ligase PIAS2-like isoform X2 [Dreissena polymorpha]|uniref:E3 SUMO-protein ligase PIAS2-like isoform X2 n=1 Tax=Dreissena polymorpha TaxID=45954 RepID=UPI0022652155|nr:E3 SUMO-protein ligase PIAS2-like isoform X2 [Dreissena polymorpha]